MASSGSTTTVPVGDPVLTGPSTWPSKSTTLEGTYTTLVPLSPKQHAADLWPSLGSPSNAHLWTYLPYGPCPTFEDFLSLLESHATSPDLVFWAIIPKPTKSDNNNNNNNDNDNDNENVNNENGTIETPKAKAAGLISYLNIYPHDHALEIGHLLYTPSLQQTRTSTETVYLLLRHAFQDLGYTRAVWKCDSLNAPSRNAATRFGFRHEGTFRRHLVVKGRRRDTLWFSLLREEEWETGVGAGAGAGAGAKAAFEDWLLPGNFDEGGRQRRGLREIRERLG